MATALVVVVAPFVINKFVAICFLAARFLRTARETFAPPSIFQANCRISFAAILDILCAPTHTHTYTHTAVSVRLCVCLCTTNC